MTNEFWVVIGLAAFFLIGGIRGLRSEPCEMGKGTSQEGLDKVWAGLWVFYGVVLIAYLFVEVL